MRPALSASSLSAAAAHGAASLHDIAAELRQRFEAARQGGLRHREAAASLGLSEGEAAALHSAAAGIGADAPGLRSVRLRGPWLDLLRALEPCGPLMALTRNEAAVHEKTGPYTGLAAQGPVALALGDDIDLRLFFNHWKAGYALHEPARQAGGTPTLSLQFFDAHGTAVHKIYPRAGTDLPRWHTVADDYADAVGALPVFTPLPADDPAPSDAGIDVAALGQAWAALRDTHEFHGLLKRHGVERQQALRLMEGRFTQRLPTDALRQLLQGASASAQPIMVFVGNPGCIQIHTGPVQRVEVLGPWLNVLDPGFNLHVRQDQLAAAWAVDKPTSDGTVSSLEVFDTQRRLVLQCFGARKPGQPEAPGWRTLLQAVRAGR